MVTCKGMVPKKLPLLLGERIGRAVVPADCHQEMDMQASQRVSLPARLGRSTNVHETMRAV